MPLKLSIVTADRTVLERDDVTRLVVPGSDGQLTLLPSHAALMVSLGIGEMLATTPEGVEPIAVHGGFLQIANDEVSVLADAAEHADDINEERADEARSRAEAASAGAPKTWARGSSTCCVRSSRCSARCFASRSAAASTAPASPRPLVLPADCLI